jgi:uncharacterized protein (DUF433 family)
MTPTDNQYKFLAPNPKSSYRQLFIKGTRIMARTIYGLSVSAEEPRSPEQLAGDYGLPVEAILEAIAYCRSNPPEITADFAAEEALMEAAGMNDPNYKYHPQPRLLSPQEIHRIIRQQDHEAVPRR